MFIPFKNFLSKKIVGIDIGTTSIKIVEVSSWRKFKQLENYGEVKSNLISKEPLLDAKTNSSVIQGGNTAIAIKEILNEAGIKTKSAIFAIPDFYTFCTSFDIPQMPEKEIPDAIRYNASQYITLPISEVTIDWKIISNASGADNSLKKVFIVAIPNQVIEDYKIVAKDAGLNLYAVEAEVFGIARALVKDSRKTICLVDIGTQSSTINIHDQGFLKKSYTSNFSGNQLTNAISSKLGINYIEAEKIKIKDGLNFSRKDVVETLHSLIDSFLREIQTIFSDFNQSDKKQIEEVYLIGGIANMLGLKEYFLKNIQKKVYIPNCFSELLQKSILKDNLREMGPRFSVAVGVALNGLEV